MFLEYAAVRETKPLWDFAGKGDSGDCCLSWRTGELVLVLVLVLVRSPSVAGTVTGVGRA
jgi:hypothetical protein